MKYGSVCSGIESATVAWHPLGWRPAFFSEIEPFPCAVLAHHYPSVANYGDMRNFNAWPKTDIDLLVGGTPCQSFSVAGLRKGLDDPRGNLTMVYLAVVNRYRPRWVVWENVPGVLSIDGGRAFAGFLVGLGELGYGFAYRVLDAQYFGVPQRRRRVFVVGYLGDWRPAAAVLFERASVSGHLAPSRETGKEITGTISSRPSAGGGLGTDFECNGGVIPANDINGISHALTARHSATGRYDPNGETFITHSLRGDGFDASEDGTGRGTSLVPIAFDNKASGRNGFGIGEISPTLRAMNQNKSHANAGGQVAVAVSLRGRDGGSTAEITEGAAPALRASQGGGDKPNVLTSAVRRLTPREYERLQGFPDDYTQVPYRGKPAADGPRYKAIGNSKAVPVVHWIGRRIDTVDAIIRAPANDNKKIERGAA